MKRLKLFLSALILSVSSLVALAAPHAFAVTKTWTGGGGDANMMTAGNWSGGAPSAGDDLVFPVDITNRTVNNDFAAATSFNSITFSGAASTASDYTFTGNSMTLVAGINNTMTGSVAKNQTFGIALILNGTQTFDDGGNGLDFNGTIGLGSSALTVDVTSYVNFDGIVSGTGTITKTGTEDLVFSAANTYSGATTVSAGRIIVGGAGTLGTSAAGTTVASGAALYFYKSSGDLTYDEPLTLAGTGTSAFSPTLDVGVAYGMGGGGATLPYPATTFTGAITLQSNIKVGAGARNGKITGAITGNYAIAITDSSTGTFELASSANGSATANSVLEPAAKETKYEADSPSTSVTVNPNETAIVTGKYGSVNVNTKGILKGTGTIGDIFVYGKLAPGLSPGCINTGSLTFISGSTYEFEVGGTTACTGYDQTVVTGNVDLGSGTLSAVLYNGFKPVAGQKYVIISNDGSDAVNGTFNGLAQGATFAVSGYTFSISYTGGDGNDVELTVTAVPPDTGFTLLTSNPFATMVLMLGAAGGIAIMARRSLKPAFARKRR